MSRFLMIGGKSHVRIGSRYLRPTTLGFVALVVIGLVVMVVATIMVDRSVDCRDPVLTEHLAEYYPMADPQTLDIVRFALSGSNEGILDRSSDDNCTSDQIVLVTGRDERVTVYVTVVPEHPNLNWISFWTRPNGTTDSRLFSTFTDHDFNCTVNFGINGDGSPNGHQRFSSPDQIGGSKGPEYQAVWQSRLEQTVQDVHEALNL